MKKWFTITLTFADGTQGGYPHEAYSLKEATQDSVGLFSAASDVVSVTVSTDSPAQRSVKQDCRTIAGRGICDMCAQGEYAKCRYTTQSDAAAKP
jgi:hypothetical protein